MEIPPYSGASIQAIILGDKRNTAILNALVCGGRTNNEMPWDYKIENVLDIDLQSCYGTALRRLTYPIGVPTVIASAQNQEKISLKEFLKKYEDELLPNLFKIVVSGKLSFEQDLIPSKVTTASEIKNNFLKKSLKHFEGEDDLSHVQSDLVLSRREILNGTITSDVLETLRSVSTNAEMKEILNLTVETAMFWKKSDRCDSPKEWIENVLLNPGSLTFSEKYQGMVDMRSRKWYGLELEEFVGKLVDTRGFYKAKAKRAKTENEKRTLNGYQIILKLFINSLYGCFASPFFSIGNCVIADVITARARVEVWKLAKALNLRQCITDGGLYTPVSVNSFKEGKELKKPGLEVLSDVRKLQKNRYIQVVPLAGKDWLSIFKSMNLFAELTNIDKLAFQHCNNFWRVYNIPLKLNIEPTSTILKEKQKEK